MISAAAATQMYPPSINARTPDIRGPQTPLARRTTRGMRRSSARSHLALLPTQAYVLFGSTMASTPYKARRRPRKRAIALPIIRLVPVHLDESRLTAVTQGTQRGGPCGMREREPQRPWKRATHRPLRLQCGWSQGDAVGQAPRFLASTPVPLGPNPRARNDMCARRIICLRESPRR